jgi:hypothetical protein
MGSIQREARGLFCDEFGGVYDELQEKDDKFRHVVSCYVSRSIPKGDLRIKNEVCVTSS